MTIYIISICKYYCSKFTLEFSLRPGHWRRRSAARGRHLEDELELRYELDFRYLNVKAYLRLKAQQEPPEIELLTQSQTTAIFDGRERWTHINDLFHLSGQSVIIPVIDTGVDIKDYKAAMLSAKERVELFHLLFLDQFGRKTEKNLYALKGGCNLRFFMKSVRYSEDIDLDVRTIAQGTLAQKVEKILGSDSLSLVLQARGLGISDVSAPKQTKSVQRWKLSVTGVAGDLPARTKIEFSRRRFDTRIKFESIDPTIIAHYKIYPVLVNHYEPQTAYQQKLEALISRTETQARDVFDLDLLLRSGAVNPKHLPDELTKRSKAAIETVHSVKFEHFKGQVLAYLDPEYQSQFDSSRIWDELVLRVIEGLETIRK